MRADIVVMNHESEHGFDTHVLEANSFGGLLKEYTKLLRQNCIHEDEVMHANFVSTKVSQLSGSEDLERIKRESREYFRSNKSCYE